LVTTPTTSAISRPPNKSSLDFCHEAFLDFPLNELEIHVLYSDPVSETLVEVNQAKKAWSF